MIRRCFEGCIKCWRWAIQRPFKSRRRCIASIIVLVATAIFIAWALVSISKQKVIKYEFPLALYGTPSCKRSTPPETETAVCRNLRETMPEKERQTYLRLLNYFDNMAKNHSWTYMMAFGTLLGSWRHHDVIPYDQDVDLYVEYKHRKDIIDKIEAQERFVPKQMVHHKIRLHDRELILGTAYYPDIGRFYGPSIDMFFFVRNATHIRRSDYPEEDVFKYDEVFPLHRRPLGPLMLPSPRDTLQHLVPNYGATDLCADKEAKCKDYEPFLPFVHRRWDNGTGMMEESLVLNGKVLQVKQIAEMKKNIPVNPYTLAVGPHK